MNWIERLNAAINYIEDNITEELDFSDIAKVAHCSSYHFQRMFILMTDMSLSSYIRQRRMSLAATDLRVEDIRIMDVALKYRYKSPTAFNRAFQNVHGIAPSLIKQDGVFVKSYSPLNFQVSVKGASGIDYRIEKKEAFRIVGISAEITDDCEVNGEIMSQLWQVTKKNGTVDQLTALNNSKPKGLIEVLHLSQDNCWASVASTKEIDNTLEEMVIPSYTWAIFPKIENVKAFLKRIFSEWLPASTYELDVGPEITLCPSDDLQNKAYEIWLPIKKV